MDHPERLVGALQYLGLQLAVYEQQHLQQKDVESRSSSQFNMCCNTSTGYISFRNFYRLQPRTHTMLRHPVSYTCQRSIDPDSQSQGINSRLFMLSTTGPKLTCPLPLIPFPYSTQKHKVSLLACIIGFIPGIHQ